MLDEHRCAGVTRTMEAAVLARCKVYEIKGPDKKRTGGAERCTREVATKISVNGRSYPLCKRHLGGRWNLFVDGGWLYAIDENAEPVKKRKGKK